MLRLLAQVLAQIAPREQLPPRLLKASALLALLAGQILVCPQHTDNLATFFSCQFMLIGILLLRDQLLVRTAQLAGFYMGVVSKSD